jgi:hypothetical protein
MEKNRQKDKGATSARQAPEPVFPASAGLTEKESSAIGVSAELDGTDPDDEFNDDVGTEEDGLASGRDDDTPLSGRRLCADGACIGVIGDNGRCRECGKPDDWVDVEQNHDQAIGDQTTDAPGTADARTNEAGEPPADDDTDENTAERDYDAQHLEDEPGSDDEGPELSDRVLCSDGSCIGLIGRDNHCKVCGKPYTGAWDEQDEDVVIASSSAEGTAGKTDGR